MRMLRIILNMQNNCTKKQSHLFSDSYIDETFIYINQHSSPRSQCTAYSKKVRLKTNIKRVGGIFVAIISTGYYKVKKKTTVI